MISLISIHIPKTGGTSFYHTLKEIYGENLSISYKRKDISKLKYDLSENPNVKVIHGHFYYKEIASLHQKTDAKVITWLRDPVNRVVSNYYFFKSRLENPSLNPRTYELNKHRIKETLLEYAERGENRNRMSKFLEGIEIEKLFFVGRLEHYKEDLKELGKQLNWNKAPVFHENKKVRNTKKISKRDWRKLEKWNELDVKLYKNLNLIKN